ncbi:MAG: protocatechuate 3,4-dioxygenase subunit alpha [Micromonosporaceae bacterium]|nr:protocatechuate 3,4-dioxygenase subunit alpha [Micromonosporaceae bacterium]
MKTEAPLGLTPSQTVGPYLRLVLPWPDGPDVVPEGTPGSFVLSGRLLDGHGDPVPDGLVETWQADPAGRFNHPDDPRGAASGPASFRGYGRCPTDDDGRFWIRTLKPGPLPTPEGGQEAPHLDVSVFARGILVRMATRCYFSDEEAANRADPVLSTVEEDRRETLVATAESGGYHWDIVLQGPGETVFFDV